MAIVRVVWASFVLTGVLFLAFFRADTGHGPDNVGTEVATFGVPLLFALITAIAAACFWPNTENNKLIGYTLGISLAAGLYYWWRLTQ